MRAWFGMLRCWPRCVLLKDLFSSEVVRAWLGVLPRSLPLWLPRCCFSATRGGPALVREVRPLCACDAEGFGIGRDFVWFDLGVNCCVVPCAGGSDCDHGPWQLVSGGENIRFLVLSELVLLAWGVSDSSDDPWRNLVPGVALPPIPEVGDFDDDDSLSVRVGAG